MRIQGRKTSEGTRQVIKLVHLQGDVPDAKSSLSKKKPAGRSITPVKDWHSQHLKCSQEQYCSGRVGESSEWLMFEIITVASSTLLRVKNRLTITIIFWRISPRKVSGFSPASQPAMRPQYLKLFKRLLLVFLFKFCLVLIKSY
jgi:hypothetical protein